MNQRLPQFFCFLVLISFCACQKSQTPVNQVSQNKLAEFPPVMLWAWERPENLEFIDTKRFGVAFLAQTLELRNDEVIFRPRRQPLKVSPETKLMAVTRIESDARRGNVPALSDAQRRQTVELILKTLERKNVSAIQIDYDATVSEREFYRQLLQDLRVKLPENVPLTMTALASFCLGDRWLADLPVDEAVPMIFRMGADDKKIKEFLSNGGDFSEPLCRKSYGLATDELFSAKLDKSRRLYIFNVQSWTLEDVQKIK